MSARIFIFPTFDRGWSDAAQAAEPEAVARRANHPREQADAEHAAAVSFAMLLIVGALCFVGGCLFTTGVAFVVSRFL